MDIKAEFQSLMTDMESPEQDTATILTYLQRVQALVAECHKHDFRVPKDVFDGLGNDAMTVAFTGVLSMLLLTINQMYKDRT